MTRNPANEGDDVTFESLETEKATIEGELPQYRYVVYKHGGNVKALDNETGKLETKSNDVFTVLQHLNDEFDTNAEHGKILVKNGQYKGTDLPVNVTGDVRYAIEGEHMNETRLIEDGSNDKDMFFRQSGASGDPHFFALRNIRLDTDASQNPNAYAVNFQGNIADLTLERMQVRNSGKGIYQNSGWHFTMRSCIVEGVDKGPALKIASSADAKLFGNKFLTNPGGGIQISSGQTILGLNEIRKMGGPIELANDDRLLVGLNQIEHLNGGVRAGQLFINGKQSIVALNAIDASASGGFGGTNYCVEVFNDPENVVGPNVMVGYGTAPVSDGHGRTRINGRVQDSYTGDGTTGRLIDCGFRPSQVIIKDGAGNIYDLHQGLGTGVFGSSPGGELSLDGAGFIVGDNGSNADPNTDTETYTFIAR